MDSSHIGRNEGGWEKGAGGDAVGSAAGPSSCWWTQPRSRSRQVSDERLRAFASINHQSGPRWRTSNVHVARGYFWLGHEVTPK